MRSQIIQKAWGNSWEIVVGQPLQVVMIAVLIFLVAFVLTRRFRGKEYASDWLFDAIAGVCAVIIVIAIVFLVEAFVVVPKTIELSNQVDQLTTDLGRAKELNQTQNANIQDYQTANMTLNSRLAAIEEANDPSAKAIKKRALLLCKQMEEFYQDYSTKMRAFSDEKREREFEEAEKIGQVMPTNSAEERHIIFQKRSKVSNKFIQKESEFRGQWSAKFVTNFRGQMAAIRDQIASLGLRDDELDRHLDFFVLTDMIWCEDFILKFEHLANRIKE